MDKSDSEELENGRNKVYKNQKWTETTDWRMSTNTNRVTPPLLPPLTLLSFLVAMTMVVGSHDVSPTGESTVPGPGPVSRPGQLVCPTDFHLCICSNNMSGLRKKLNM